MPKYCNGIDGYLSRFKVKPGKALIVGSHTHDTKEPRQRLYEDAIGLDIQSGPGVDIVHDLETHLDMTFSHVDCCSVLEHCKRPWLVAENIERCLEEGGTLLVAVPFAWRIHAYPSDYWRMSVDALPILFPNIQWVNRCYVSGSEIKRLPPKIINGELCGTQRTETFGFGIRVPSH